MKKITRSFLFGLMALLLVNHPMTLEAQITGLHRIASEPLEQVYFDQQNLQYMRYPICIFEEDIGQVFIGFEFGYLKFVVEDERAFCRVAEFAAQVDPFLPVQCLMNVGIGHDDGTFEHCEYSFYCVFRAVA